MNMITLILIIVVLVVFVAMCVAIFRLMKLINNTKETADAMSQEEINQYEALVEEDTGASID